MLSPRKRARSVSPSYSRNRPSSSGLYIPPCSYITKRYKVDLGSAYTRRSFVVLSPTSIRDCSIETLQTAAKELSDATGLADVEEEQFSPPLRVSRRVAEIRPAFVPDDIRTPTHPLEKYAGTSRISFKVIDSTPGGSKANGLVSDVVRRDLQHALPVKTSSYREASSIDSDEEGTLEDDESVDLDGETVLDEGEEDDNEHHCLEVIASQGSNSIKMECDDLNQHILYMATQPGLRVRLIVRGEWAHLVFAKDKPTREELAIVNEQTYPEKRLEVRERVDPTLSDGETVVEVENRGEGLFVVTIVAAATLHFTYEGDGYGAVVLA